MAVETNDFIFRSKLPDIQIPNHLPLHDYVFQTNAQFGSRPCLIDAATGHVYSYNAVQSTARRVAGGLQILGIKKGDVIMNLLPNSPEFVFTFLAASYGGATMTAANPFYTAVEIAKQAKSANVKLIVTMACFYDRVKDLAENGVKIVCVDFAVEGCLHYSVLSGADEIQAPVADFASDDMVALPYSSGTTGLPKGVMLTHKGIVTSVSQQVDGQNPNLYYRGDDVILCVLPLFHIYSLSSILLCGLRAGAAIVLMQKFEIVSVFQLVEKYRVSVLPIVPPIFSAIAKSPEFEKYDMSSVRVLKSGGAPLVKEVEDAVRGKFPGVVIGQGYGMTEAGSVLTMSLALAKEPFPVKDGACGTVMRNAEMKIVDIKTGVSLPANSSGEIWIRGDQIMKGYLNDLESTKNTVDKEGWLHTGDIGFVDDDDEVFVVDRLKELIKCKTFQVAPAELEALLIAHPNISDAAVIGMPDEQAGEVPVAFVVKENDVAIIEEDVKQFISKQVIFYKRLKRVFFVKAIPKAPSGKILRKELRAQLASGAYN